MTSGARWEVVERRVFEALRDHASGCSLCDVPPGRDVRVSSSCQPGIVLLTEWFLAKMYAEGAQPHAGAGVVRS